ncbi:carboxypeptidase regulatory-like domain-containing protein [Gimesia sp.]|uniref:carboxypeptidase regulatory-like domain-containing protein n=1 Tax=Gimesia sp. TaxID=2024833 RepID=UPI003A954EB3
MRWVILTLLICCYGCGSDKIPTYPVSGRVQFADGEPVRTGTIELESEEHGTSATGTIQEDGTFVLGTYTPDDGAAAGKHRAIVVQIIISDGITKHTKDHGRAVPPLYGGYDSSPLSVEVQAIPQNEVLLSLPMKPETN